ncbi:TauD/TfdA family dioxygenase [Bartonella massiliensis]|uniref:TauD/TfdA family dioxygenase n=1 Tax=Bartonella massiliensis TaxID=929795 RepID=UPI001FE2D4E1|nr:TauD/TfdA family dioxygenase [Bartonella massiliensis]
MSITPRPYLIFEKLPIDRQINTSPNPYNLDASCKSGYISENLIMMFSLLIGEPYSIKFEGEHIVNNLVPLKDNKTDYTGLGSEVKLDFHIENAALKFITGLNLSPKGILLSGVRNDVNGPLTRISDAHLALKLLSEGNLSSLRDNLYRINVPYRWKNGVTSTTKVPHIQGDSEFLSISAVFYPGMFEPQSKKAKEALDHFYEAIKAVSFGIDVQPGRLLYIDNKMALHSRDKFWGSFDRYENPMRWIQRVFVSADLWNHRDVKQIKERVFDFHC